MLWLKEQVIHYMHNPIPSSKGRLVNELGRSVVLPLWLASAYHFSQWGYFGLFVTMVVLSFYHQRRLIQS